MKKKLLNQLLSVSLSAVMLAGSVYTVPAADFTAEESISAENEARGTSEDLTEEAAAVSTDETQDEITIGEDSDDFSDSTSDGDSEEVTVEDEEISGDTEAEISLEEGSEFQDDNVTEEETPATGATLHEGKCGDNVTWRIADDHVLYIEGYGDMDNWNGGILPNPWYVYNRDFNQAHISEGVTSIGDRAFWGTNISYVNIPSSITRIGKNAFTSVTFEGFTQIKLSSKITEIGEYAFAGSGISSLNLSDLNLTEIPKGLVKNCQNLSYFYFPSNATKIGEYAFAECPKLSGMNIPNGITSIGGAAFMDCTGLTNVYIPASVTDTGYIWEKDGLFGENIYGIFTGCTGLKTAGNGSSYNINLGWGSGSILPTYIFTCADKLESVALPTGMTGVQKQKNPMEYGAFRCCVKLTSVTIPDSFTDFGYGLFYGCETLPEIRIPSGVKELNGTFIGCKALTKVVIPDGVTHLGSTFANCTSLESVNIPDSVIAFSGDNWNFWGTLGTFENCSELTKLTVPGSVEETSGQDFMGTAMDSVGPIGSGMALEYGWKKTIPYGAFRGMIVQEVRFPDTITEIGDEAFRQCRKLKRIALPEGLTEISKQLFEECDSLTTVKLPEKITGINYRAFADCPSLKNIRFKGDAFTYCYENAFLNDELTAWYPGDNTTWKRNKRKNYGGKITWKKYKDGKPVDDVTTRNVTINGSGKATVRFFLTDKDGNAVPETHFEYERRSDAQNDKVYQYTQWEIMSEMDGGYAFETPVYTPTNKNETYNDTVTYTVHWTDDAGEKYSKEFTVNVAVKPMSYTETWSTGLGVEASLGDKEASWFSYGHSSESKISLKHNPNGTEDLTLSLTLSDAQKAKLKMLDGKWGSTDLDTVNVFKTTGSAKATEYSTYSTTINNFKTTNKNHQELVVTYLELIMLFKADVTGLVKNTDAFLSSVIGKSLVSGNLLSNFEVSEDGIKVGLSGSSTILTLTDKLTGTLVGDMKFGNLSTDTTYSASQKVDSNTGQTVRYAGVKATAQYALISNQLLSLIGDAGGLIGGSLVNSTSLSLDSDDKVTLSETRYNSGIKEQVGYDDTISSLSRTFSAADQLLTADNSWYSTLKTKLMPISSGELAKVQEAMLASELEYTYSRSDNLTNTYSFSPSIKIFGKGGETAGKDPLLNLGFSLSYSHGWGTETSNGTVKSETVLTQSDSMETIRDAQNDVDSHKLNDILLAGAKGIPTQVGDLISNATDIVGKVISNGSAVIKSELSKFNKNWHVNLVCRAKTSTTDLAGSFEVFTVADEEAAVQAGAGNEDAGKTASTVGDACIVQVVDANGKEVSDISEAALKITLKYTDAELEEAEASAADASDLAVYRLDEESGAYIYVADSVVDEENHQVTATAAKNGEYVLILDGAAPSVTDINVFGRTSENPVITANIMDASGVSSVIMSVDGKELVSADKFAKYYKKSSGEFSYKMDSALSKGEHTVSFTAVDGKGKTTDSVDYTFTVGDAPKFKEISVPPYTVTGDSFTVKATVPTDTDEKYVVSAKIWTDRANYAFNMTEKEEGSWEGTFTAQDTNLWYYVQLTVSNGNGDETQSEKYTCKFTEADENVWYVLGDVKYRFMPATGEISNLDTKREDLTIPEEIVGWPVKKLTCNLYELKSVTIPECVEEIDCSCASDLVVSGYTNTQAEFWAKKEGLKFKSLGTGNSGYHGTFSYVSWNYKDGLLTLSGEGSMYDEWGADDYPWYVLRNDIVKVVIEEGVTNVGYCAFSDDYKKLKEAEIAKSVTDIGNCNFKTCDTIYGYYGSEAESYANKNDITFKALEALNGKFGDNDEFTWEYEDDTLTISGTGKLPDYTKGDSTRPWYGPVYPYRVEKVIIKEGITGIGSYTFEEYSYLNNVSLPDTLETIGDYAFIACRSLTSCLIPDRVTSIGEKALGFYYGYDSNRTPEANSSFVVRGESETAKKYAEDNGLVSMKPDEKLNLSDCTILVWDAEYQGGKEVIPSIDAYNAQHTAYIHEGVDYEVRFENNRNIGTATAIFTGIGLYTGTEERNFDIYAPDNGDDDDNNNGNNGNNNGNNGNNNGGFKHEHVYGGWKLTKASTVFERGIMTRTCRICGSKDSTYIDKADPTGSLNMSSIPLKVKQSTTVVKARGLAAGDYVKSYSTSNPKIATVNAKGKIKAKKKGNTNLIVKLASGKTLKAKIKVQKGAVKTKKISVNKKKITLKRKKSFQLRTTVTPLTSRQKVTYSSSNKKVVTVSKTGKLVAKKAGKAKITIKSGSKKVTVTVTVKK